MDLVSRPCLEMRVDKKELLVMLDGLFDELKECLA